ncbi:uncharacterized protein LOC144439755 [Glandiceps talaboti]
MVSSHQKWQVITFTLTWLAYASTYLLRKNLGVIKADLELELSLSKPQLGWLDTAFLLPYATLQVLVGPIGDYYGARKTLSCCLLLAAVSMVTCGQWSAFQVFAMLYFMNGCAQSQAWPNCVKGLGFWFREEQRSTLFGIWGTCVFAGGIFGTVLAVYLQSSYGWRYVFSTPSYIVAVIGILIYFFLRTPEEVAAQISMSNNGNDAVNSNAVKHPSETSIGMLQLLKIPMLPELAIATFCVKMVRYCMYMWLPMYLHQHLGYEKSEAGMLSLSYEIGGVAGSALLGFIIDRWLPGKTTLGCVICTILSTVALLLFLLTSNYGMLFNILSMVLFGVFNCGPDPILTGTLPLELGQMNGRNIQAALSGFVNGCGSIGTVLQGPLIGFIIQYYNWESILYVMVVICVVGSLALIKASWVKRTVKPQSPVSV